MYNYDENLEQNIYFINIKKKYKKLFEEACQNKYYILVPKKDALDNFNQNDEITVKRHVLVADETRNGSFYNLLGEELCSCGSQLTLFSCDNIPCCQAQILFEESYIPQETNGRSCRLLCINRLLTIENGTTDFSELEPKGPSSDSRILVEGYDYYVKLLFSDDLQGVTKGNMLKRFDSFVSRIQSEYCHSWLVGQLKVRAESEFKSLLNFLLLRKKRKAKVLDEKEIFCLQLAAEIYFYQCIHNSFFPLLSACVRDDEAQLNTNRHLAEALSPADLGISTQMLDALPLAKRELAKLNDNHTPYGKLLCMRKCMEILTSGPSLNGSWTSLSSDDMLPALVFLVIKLNHINNWASNLSFVMDFHFSKFADDELSYCLASFEATIQYLKSGSLKDIVAEKFFATTSATTKDFLGVPDTSPSLMASYQKLVEHLKSGNVKSVEQLFSDQGEISFGLAPYSGHDEVVNSVCSNCGDNDFKCHPLCKCNSCVKNLADRLSSTFNINTKFVFGLTALHLACFLSKSAMTKMLGKKLNAIIDARDDLDRTPLHLACMAGSQGCTLLLLDMGAKQTALDCRGFTPLHTAVYYGHVDCVKALLYFVDQKQESGEPNINAVDRFGESALFFAVKYCYAEIVQVLLENGASQRVVNKRRHLVKDLCDNVYISRLLSNDDQAVEYVVFDPKNDSFDISSLYDHKTEKTGSNHVGAPCNDAEKVAKLLSAVADNDLPMVKFHLGTVDDHDAKAEMCHPLCQCDRCIVATEAVESYLNPNCVGVDGLAALHIASKYGYVELVAYLVRCGANPNFPSSQSTNCRTALHFAAEFGCTEVMEVLLCNVANLNALDTRSNTPLHYAASKGHLDCIKLLLKFGADVNGKNAEGDTPLHLAAKCERLEAMQFLVSHGANPMIPNELRLSPVDFVNSEDAERIFSKRLNL